MSSLAHYHLTGVAGVGMSAVAQVLALRGHRVTGSDRSVDHGLSLRVVDALRSAGVGIVPQDGAALGADTRGLVVSTAIEDDNVELQAARRLGVPVIHRAEMLAQLMEGQVSVAVTGTCGKSTVTGMIGHMLAAVGRDPTVVNGAPVLNWSGSGVGNVRCGASSLWVFEADESDRSLMCFSPDWAVITNVSADHFGLDESRRLFAAFRARVRRGLVDPTEDPSFWDGFAPVVEADSSHFTRGGTRFDVPLPGRHNAENAFCAVALCERLGCDPAGLSRALADFRGIERRLQVVGRARGTTVIDDYAHNPAKIRAAWSSLAPYHRCVHGVWRPHGYGPLAKMMDDLVAVLAGLARAGDSLVVLPVYDAGGTANRAVDAGCLVDRLRDRGVNAVAARDYEHAAEWVARAARPGDVVLSMGARDPELSRLARRLLDVLEAGAAGVEQEDNAAGEAPQQHRRVDGQ